MFDKWIDASYLYDANKILMGSMFMSKYKTKFNKRVLLDYYQKSITVFYVDLCAVLDHANKKKECHTDSIIESIYYERDKNAAHKDFGYNPSKNDKNMQGADMPFHMFPAACYDVLRIPGRTRMPRFPMHVVYSI